MRTIYYLIDMYERRLIDTFEGQDDVVPPDGRAAAEAKTKETGHTYVLARGVEFHQND